MAENNNVLIKRKATESSLPSRCLVRPHHFNAEMASYIARRTVLDKKGRRARRLHTPHNMARCNIKIDL